MPPAQPRVRRPVIEGASPHPRPNFSHLETLTGDHGLYEHARYAEPRRGHGYTTDDNARAVVLLSRLGHDHDARRLIPKYLEMVLAGLMPGGWRNRLDDDGGWETAKGSDDCHGRAIWALGVAMRDGPSSHLDAVREAFVAGAALDSPWLRSNAYACLGAAAAAEDPVVGAAAGRLLERLRARLPHPRHGSWRWPEERLTYANARIPEAYIAIGNTLAERRTLDAGLELLEWLVGVEWSGEWFSFTPVAGRGPGETGPAFDQQPIEAWAMVDACIRAGEITGDGTWGGYAEAAAEWFFGRNDVGVALYEPVTGAGYDGLTPDGVNSNRGAESTLSALAAVLAVEGDR